MTAEGERIYIGGLMRCCMDTLYRRTAPAVDGERQPCAHCTSGAIFRAGPTPEAPDAIGAWHWDRGRVANASR